MGRLIRENGLLVYYLIGRATTTVHYRHEYLRETTWILSFHQKIERTIDFITSCSKGK